MDNRKQVAAAFGVSVEAMEEAELAHVQGQRYVNEGWQRILPVFQAIVDKLAEKVKRR